MYIDKRGMKILQEIINNPNITLPTLEKKLGINQRQINYSFEKINNWISSLNQPEIERTKKGNFIISSSLIHILPLNNNDNDEIDVENYILSENERIPVILLILLSRDEELSLIHLTSALGFGKNTILGTIKKAQSYLGKYQLKIIYSRQDGYKIQGQEIDKRRLLVIVIHSIISFYGGEKILQHYSMIEDSEVEALRNKLEQIEVYLSIKFTDERLLELPFIMAVWINRVNQRKIIEPNFNIDFSDLKDTKEYLAIVTVFPEFESIPPKELLFLTLQLLTMNISSSQVLNDDRLSDLKHALFEMVKIIENISAIEIPKKNELIDKLLLHVKPAYYRIKYNLGLMTSMFSKFDGKLEDLHEIVKKSTGPIESLLGCSIPESENTFLTMIVGGWLTQHEVQLDINNKKVAAVVCPNGVSVSRLLQVNLKSVFTEYIFLEPMSHREFSNYQGKIDILFTTHRLPTDIKQYIVSTVINIKEINELKKRKIHEMYGLVPYNLDFKKLIEAISPHVEIKDSNGLLESLSGYFSNNNMVSDSKVEKKSKLTLKDLVHSETITILDKVEDWKEALWLASEPLLKNNYIGPNYVEAMIEQYQSDSSYIMLAKNIAIPHSRPGNDVYQIGMSFLKLSEPVEFSGGNFIKLICVIAAVDKEQHICPILQLGKLAESKQGIESLLKAKTKKEIFSVIEKFSMTESKEG
jgi:transcriptional antiterminator/mannitol/fructose-specific phosphotransferase system IIA component (Ntr-type)